MDSAHSLFYKKYPLSKLPPSTAKYAWHMKSQKGQSTPDLLIPDGYPELIFVLKGGYKKDFVNPEKSTSLINRSCLIGIQTHTVLARRVKECHLIGVKLYPWGAYRLVGDKLRQASNENLPLEELSIEWLSVLNKGVVYCENPEQGIKLITEALERQVNKREAPKDWKKAESYLRTILESEGQIRVQDLANAHHVSIRHFQRKFKQYYGLSPKKFINLIRFKQLYKESILQQQVPQNFLKFGYYDQIHFIRDFRKHLGITPSSTLDKAFLQLNEMAKWNY